MVTLRRSISGMMELYQQQFHFVSKVNYFIGLTVVTLLPLFMARSEKVPKTFFCNNMRSQHRGG